MEVRPLDQLLSVLRGPEKLQFNTLHVSGCYFYTCVGHNNDGKDEKTRNNL